VLPPNSYGSFAISDVMVSNKGREGGKQEGEAIALQFVSAREAGDREGEVVDLRPQAALRPYGDAPPEEAVWHVDVIVDARPVS
jgi:hypothetical protein